MGKQPKWQWKIAGGIAIAFFGMIFVVLSFSDGVLNEAMLGFAAILVFTCIPLIISGYSNYLHDKRVATYYREDMRAHNIERIFMYLRI